jgi:polar amino acid transport system substrate-binding protein
MLREMSEISPSSPVVPLLVLALLAPSGLSSPAAADRLDTIRSTAKLTLGYRLDSRPFSYKDATDAPAGFSVVLCQKVAEEIKTELNLPSLTVEWSPVPVDNSSLALQQGKIDLLCGPDTVTLSRRQEVSFSIPIFASGVGAIMRSDSPTGLRDVLEGKPATGPLWRGSPARILQKKTFTLVKGTTSEAWMAERLQAFQLDASVIPVESYAAGINAIIEGQADVFFGDRAVIMEAAGPGVASGELVPLNRLYTREPIALSMARDNDSLRLIVDRGLSHFYRSPDFRTLYLRTFGEPTASAMLFYQVSTLPD